MENKAKITILTAKKRMIILDSDEFPLDITKDDGIDKKDYRMIYTNSKKLILT